MAVLLNESFLSKPTGAPTPTAAGQPWVLTGDGVLRVDGTPGSARLHLTPGNANGYAQVDIGGKPTKITSSFMFDAGGLPNICLISHAELPFRGYDLGLHFQIRPDQMVAEIRYSGGSFVGIWGMPFSPNLPRTTQLGLILNLAANGAVTGLAPDGSPISFQDSRVADMIGRFLVLQVIRANGTDPEGAWFTVSAEGDPVARIAAAQTSVGRTAVAATPTPITGDPTNGHSTPNGLNTVIWVKNNNGASTARWIEVERAGVVVDGATAPARRYTLAAGASGFLRDFPVQSYGTTLNINVEHADITFYVLTG